MKHRPILVRLTSSNDVSSITSNCPALAKLDNITIQPDLSPYDRKILSILLRKKKDFKEEGVDRKEIKIKGNSILVNGSTLMVVSSHPQNNLLTTTHTIYHSTHTLNYHQCPPLNPLHLALAANQVHIEFLPNQR